MTLVLVTACASESKAPARLASESALPSIKLADQTLLPIYRPVPYYPKKAVERGLESWVDFVFDLDTLGRTKNIRILDSKPRSIFNKTALRSVEGYRYDPVIQDGQAVEVQGVQIRVSFALQR